MQAASTPPQRDVSATAALPCQCCNSQLITAFVNAAAYVRVYRLRYERSQSEHPEIAASDAALVSTHQPVAGAQLLTTHNVITSAGMWCKEHFTKVSLRQLPACIKHSTCRCSSLTIPLLAPTPPHTSIRMALASSRVASRSGRAAFAAPARRVAGVSRRPLVTMALFGLLQKGGNTTEGSAFYQFEVKVRTRMV